MASKTACWQLPDTCRPIAGPAVRGWYTPAMLRKNKAISLSLGVTLGMALTLMAAWGAGLRVAVAAPPGQAATDTPPPNRVEIFQDVNVRGGPCTCYDQVGVLLPGQTSAIIGRNPEGTWYEIEYVGGPDGIGWVFKDLVRVIGDVNRIPTVIPPPTPTLPPTTTPLPGVTAGPHLPRPIT